MTLRHLRIFAEVYRAGNVTRAAEVLHMTQPAVTRAVQELEQHYGVRLFERMYRHLSPTEGGRRLYPQAVHLLDAFDRMETGLRDWDSLGVVRVGATVTLGGALLPGLALHPAWESVSTEALLQAAAEGLGVAVLPEQRAQPAAQGGRICLRPIGDGAFVRRRVIAWHREKYLTASMQRFIDLCRAQAR